MKINILRNCILFILFISLTSWGEKGHYKINSSCTQFFPNKIKHLQDWSTRLAEHGSDADKRRRTDRFEGGRHYIDIDNYTDFVKNHKIIEDHDAAFQTYRRDFVTKNGTLPWATDSTYHALVQNFKMKDWNRALLTAADLGHYVGDAHMPLHLTTNYDGILTGQLGIHERYESIMINKYITEINVDRSRIRKIKNVKAFIFNYIYNNYQYKDSLLAADKLAFTEAKDEYSTAYYQSLWKNTKGFTNILIAGSSKAMAELIYTAWIEAGKPKVPKNTISH